MKTSFLELSSGGKAFEILANASFRKQWLNLHAQCEYATIFQHPSYVETWYKTYRNICQPVLVISRTKGEIINGLWFLTYDKATKKLEHAGTNQAEYQVWITTKGYETEFLSESWNLLKLELDFHELQLKYLPGDYLFKYLQTSESTKKLVVGRQYKRPFLTINENTIRDLFSAKKRRKIAKFEKIGKAEFVRVKTIEEFDAIFDQLVDFYDFRIGALKNIIPFRADRFKREFHRNLFLSDSENIILTVTYLDGQPVAGVFSGLSKNTYCFLLLMHAPFLNKYSPGYVHVLQFCQFANNENIEKIDFTPGGDSWKDRFSTDSDQVVYAIIYKSKLRQVWAQLKISIREGVRNIFSKFGINISRAKNSISSAFCYFKALISERSFSRHSKLQRFECPREGIVALKLTGKVYKIKENSINDILSFMPDARASERCEFFSKIYGLIEAGAVSYTVTEENCLLANVWAINNRVTVKTGEGGPNQLPSESTALLDLYFNHEKLTGEEATAILINVLKRILLASENEKIYAIVEPENLMAINVIKSLNFKRKV